jgi:DNA-binding NarL/FixJ family response regulator
MRRLSVRQACTGPCCPSIHPLALPVVFIVFSLSSSPSIVTPAVSLLPPPQDIVMVRSNGAAVTAMLKSRGLALRVYAMTANNSTADIARYTAAGMEPFVVAKPFTQETLRSVLRAVRDDAGFRSSGSDTEGIAASTSGQGVAASV